MLNKLFSIKSQKGVLTIEYALLAAVLTLTTLGTVLSDYFPTIAGYLQ